MDVRKTLLHFLKISKADSFKEHLNQYDVIKINMQTFFSKARSAEEMLVRLREMPGGKGFADIVWLPRPMHQDKPAVVIELKKDKGAEGAIVQIKQKNYVKSLEDYKGNLLLVGISYDKDKKHTCVIEKLVL